ncbi:NUDIX domain-containing protein [Candidatus Woesearchaeota archaeon]|nr:NUDIX domain-containing protein [Candidatus Woesearchaeota archaeon]
MQLRKSAKAIIFDKVNGHLKFLIVKKEYKEYDYWQFVGGGIKEGETPKDAVIREIKEELDIVELGEIKQLSKKCIGYKFTNDKHEKEVYFCIVQIDSKLPIKLDEEHTKYIWGSKEEILNTLMFEQQKRDFINIIEENMPFLMK